MRRRLNWCPDVNSTAERQEILNAVKRLEPWYHPFHLADWLKTGATQSAIPASVRGNNVLDMGCWEGLHGYQ
jgi:hypothetical protein